MRLRPDRLFQHRSGRGPSSRCVVRLRKDGLPHKGNLRKQRLPQGKPSNWLEHHGCTINWLRLLHCRMMSYSPGSCSPQERLGTNISSEATEEMRTNMAGRGSTKRSSASRVVIHRRNGTISISHGGTALSGYISPRFQTPDEAQAYYEQQGYIVASSNQRKVILIKRDGSCTSSSYTSSGNEVCISSRSLCCCPNPQDAHRLPL